MKWEKVKLGKYVEILSGFAFKSKDFLNCGVPVIKIKNITQEGVTLEDVSYISKELADKNEKYHLNYNDILIALTGSHINQMSSVVGRIARVKYHEDSLLNQRVGKVFAKDSKLCDIDYVYYFLSQDYIKISLASKAGGAANQANISPNDVKSLTVRWPDIETQHRIADILSAYDDLIENNQKQIKLLEEAAQRLYKEWFVDLRFPGYENTKIVDGVPEGWSTSTVSEVSAVLRRGISPKYNEKARGIVINQKCIRQTIVSYDEARTQEKKYPAELEMMESDIVICSTGAGTLGRVGQIFEAKENVTLDSHVTLIRANEKIGQQSLFWSLKMKQDYLMNAGKGSTNQLELSRETIGNCEILIPERKIAEQVEKNFVAIHNKMKECSMQIARLREARNLLLPKLMSGEVEV